MLKTGFSSRVINPPQGVSLMGYFNRRPNTGVLDDIKVRVALFCGDSGVPAGLVSLDLVYPFKNLLDAIGSELKKRTGSVSFENLIFCATHTHTGPDLYDSEAPFPLDGYIEFVAKVVVDCLVEAHSRMEPATMKIARTNNNPYAFIRRYWMKNGKVVTNPGKLNPDIVRPESEVDPEISIISFYSKSKKEVIGMIANICNHTDTIGGNLVSADWPGVLEKEIRKSVNGTPTVITLVGASGDVNHFNVSNNECQTWPAEAERIGKGYAEILSGILAKAEKIDDGHVNASSVIVETRKRTISREELSAARDFIAKVGEQSTEKEFTSEELAQGNEAVLVKFAEMLVTFSGKEGGKKIELPVKSISIGAKFAICSLPGEPFNAIGTEIKKKSSFKYTFIASNAMDACGYIPLKECFGRGGYETLPVPGGGVETDTADKIIEAATGLLSKEE
jgi:neutral ceramidase